MQQLPDQIQRFREHEEHEKDLVTFRLGSRRRFRATAILGAAAIVAAFLHVSEARPFVAISVTFGIMIVNFLLTRFTTRADTHRPWHRYAFATLDVFPVSTVVMSTPAPSNGSSNRLRIRAASGFGRRLRGIAHARLKAFWIAPPAPRHP